MCLIKSYIKQKSFCIKILLLMFFASLIFVVSHLKIHPTSHLNTFKALTVIAVKKESLLALVILMF